jgi:Putative Zn-dependent protease, contains TPR repeats
MKIRKMAGFLIIGLISVILLRSVSFADSLVGSWALGLEKNIGFYNYQSITATKAVVHLPPMEEQHLQHVFQGLVQYCSRNRELKYSLTVVRDDNPNAFALPAGYVFINSGLLTMIKNDGELAGILGHELGHIERRHSMKAIYRAAGFSLALSLLRNDVGNLRRPQEIARIAGLSMSLAQLGYSRGAELEADRYGVAIMEQAGYNKKDILHFWQRFRSRYGDTSKTSAVLSTHPPTSERIRQIENLP